MLSKIEFDTQIKNPFNEKSTQIENKMARYSGLIKEVDSLYSQIANTGLAIRKITEGYKIKTIIDVSYTVGELDKELTKDFLTAHRTLLEKKLEAKLAETEEIKAWLEKVDMV